MRGSPGSRLASSDRTAESASPVAFLPDQRRPLRLHANGHPGMGRIEKPGLAYPDDFARAVFPLAAGFARCSPPVSLSEQIVPIFSDSQAKIELVREGPQNVIDKCSWGVK